MAGESPDKSEQRKSSEGTAPGTSDPRLAVFRSVPDPEAGAVSGSQSGDARLREAVAAWVAAADEPAGDPSGESADGPSDGSSDGKDPSGADGADGVAGAADTSGADGAEGAEGAAEEASKTHVMAGPPADTPETADEDESDSNAESTGEGAQGASGAATASEAPQSAPEGAGARTGASGGADAPAEANGDADSDDAPESAAIGTGGTGTGGTTSDTATGTTDAKASEGAGSGSGSGSDADSGADADVDAADADAEADKPAAKPAARADAESDADGKTDADAEADAATADTTAGDTPGATSDAKPEAEPDVANAKSAPKGDAKDDAKAEAKADAKADAKAEAKGTPKADNEADGEAVDQPTGIFRVPSRPVIDRPTTTLKRSTFVPLRPDDVPGERKKQPAPVPSPAKPPAGIPAASSTTSATGPTATAAGAGAAQPGVVEPTRQLAMPPKPPLDLLAELTNKPAPPETPVRTVVRRFKIWTPLVILLLIIFAVVQAVRPLPDPSLSLTAAPSYSFGGSKVTLPWPSEGQGKISVAGLGTVDGFGDEKPVPIASMAKSMTAYLILQDHPMKPGAKGASIPVDATAEKEGHYDKTGGESTLNTIKKGDVLSEKDALSAIMIPSANNVARLLARWDSGSEAVFVKKMNDTAKKLGMTNTKYTDPSGLTASTVSTAADQVKLGQELVKIPALMDITKLPSWTDPSGKTWGNYNRLVPYNGAIGMKTGSTTNAGASLLFAAEQKVGGTTQYIVGAILSQHKTPIIDTVNAVSKTALLATESALTSRNVVKKGEVVGYVDDGLGGQTPVVATRDFEAAGWAGLKVDIKIGNSKTIPHSAKAGTVVGQLTVGSGPGKVSAPVALQKDLPEPGFGAKLTRVG
ncbi:D-alanyl-D-alanine carboxypeptidase [Streptomyces sp. NBC_01306]|uniref:D-alanyl-D-alanine carboxypeptidase n=1 Tax=Streptomyces sp. NBC_01306 TaxID=2903819 RepID=UPI00225C42BB|nr:D-alanyl-D-alanine carboxypeptidase [Streptomyces sp. NBC_01306]MCX4725959.1 D-alanyl-D-alanine carboxypeptidase [Streptomyces sp. NBC_01306]